MMKTGTPICAEPLLTVDNITDVVPCRYDGVEEQYVACEPSKATGHMVITHGEFIYIELNCGNKEQLIDIM